MATTGINVIAEKPAVEDTTSIESAGPQDPFQQLWLDYGMPAPPSAPRSS
jgi:hypothetical protein